MKMMLLMVLLAAGLIGTTVVLAQGKSSKPAGADTAGKPQDIGPEAFDALRKDTNNVVVLDVRTQEENKAGRIPGSVLIDFNAGDFEQQMARLDKSKTYLVHCAAGGRSARACKKMEKMGFAKLYNLEGGMGAWEKAGKPVEK